MIADILCILSAIALLAGGVWAVGSSEGSGAGWQPSNYGKDDRV